MSVSWVRVRTLPARTCCTSRPPWSMAASSLTPPSTASGPMTTVTASPTTGTPCSPTEWAMPSSSRPASTLTTMLHGSVPTSRAASSPTGTLRRTTPTRTCATASSWTRLPVSCTCPRPTPLAMTRGRPMSSAPASSLCTRYRTALLRRLLTFPLTRTSRTTASRAPASRLPLWSTPTHRSFSPLTTTPARTFTPRASTALRSTASSTAPTRECGPTTRRLAPFRCTSHRRTSTS